MAAYMTRSTHGKRKFENKGIIQAELSAPETDQEVSQRFRNEREERMREYDKAYARYMSGEDNAMDEFEVEVEEEEEEHIVASGAHSEGANPTRCQSRPAATTGAGESTRPGAPVSRSAHSQRRAFRMVMQWQDNGQPCMVIPTNAFANGPRAYRPDKDPDKDR
jgi:hypothetical protein